MASRQNSGSGAKGAANIRTLRQTKEEIEAALDQLDRPEAGLDSNRRGADRFSYRVRALRCDFQGPSGTWAAHCLPSRNISAHGMGLVTGQFVYPRTRCIVHLISIHNHSQPIPGVVAHCRYVVGTGGIHQVGIRFDHAIDVAMFHREAVRTSVLVVDDDSMMHKVVQRFVKGTNIQVECIADGAAGIEAAKSGRFDMVLMDLQMPNMDGFQAIVELRQMGYFRPVIAFTARSDEQTQAKVLEAGFNDWLVKPFTREALVATICTHREQILVSSLVHDQSMADLIDGFVAKLEGSVKEMELAFCNQQFDVLEEAVRRLKGEAGTYGFDAITSAAADLEALLAAGQPDAQVVRRKLTEISRLCLAARPVSCLVDEAH